MTVRWQERRVENDLLKRELLLRLRAERRAAEGRSGPATDYFRRRVRRLMLGHPLFAFKYYLLAVDLGLGRLDAGDRDRCADGARGGRRLLSANRMRTGALGPGTERGAPRAAQARGRRQARAVAVTGLLTAAAAAALIGTQVLPSGRTSSSASPAPRPSRPIPSRWWHPPRRVAAPRAARQDRPRTSQAEKRPTTKKPRRAQPGLAPRTILVSSTVPETPPSTAAAGRPSVTAHDPGPAPLPSPPGTPPPSPLKAP